MIGLPEELEAVAEGVADVEAFITREWLIVVCLDTGGLETSAKFGEIIDEEGRMGFPGRPKVGLDTEMDPDVFSLEPAAAPRRKMGWLLNLWHV
jgi:hypothetical protein